MPRKIKFYIILITGIVVLLVGLLNFFTNYGNTTFIGVVNQITAVIITVGGLVNLLVASNIKKEISMADEKKRNDSGY